MYVRISKNARISKNLKYHVELQLQFKKKKSVIQQRAENFTDLVAQRL